ncbi:hypothetical protein INT43_006460 [Umbelopsis isabellina]|uniref:Uncharacterized protein n=1 Tax=Mortierella isabellina TaxID=91625 RepID=A0A8H7Q1Q5_MORIS|nr:hypothetical protein INT43_006460 [Umbelopsis isabellina]
MPSVEKISQRVTETRWSIIFVFLATFQAIVIIAIQAAIAYENTTESNQLKDSAVAGIPDAGERFDRMRWENIAFCGFQVWFCVMAYDSVVNQNVAEAVAIFAFNLICAVLGALEILDNNLWIKRLQTSVDVSVLKTAEKIEIVLAVILPLLALIFALPTYKLVKQLGWTRYKKIGADLSIDRMFRLFQRFVLLLKINIFTEFIVSLFFVIKGGSSLLGPTTASTSWQRWMEAVQIVVTALMIPMLYFARSAVSAESPNRMISFIVFQVVVIFHFALMLYNTLYLSDKWVIWLCFVIMGIIIAITTIVLAAMCKNNFGKGLKPLVQRGAAKQAELKEMHALQEQETWKIDD